MGAADGQNLGDSQGQQGTTNLEVSGRFTAPGPGRETAGLGFHTAAIGQLGSDAVSTSQSYCGGGV